jgi:hypothetical protein
MLQAIDKFLDQTDFTVVVKNRAAPPKPWRWKIYRAGSKEPDRVLVGSFIRRSRPPAEREIKALKQLLTEFRD